MLRSEELAVRYQSWSESSEQSELQLGLDLGAEPSALTMSSVSFRPQLIHIEVLALLISNEEIFACGTKLDETNMLQIRGCNLAHLLEIVIRIQSMDSYLHEVLRLQSGLNFIHILVPLICYVLQFVLSLLNGLRW